MRERVWSIPAIHMKSKRPFVVALSGEVIRLLTSLPTVSDYIFPSPSDFAKPMSNNTMLSLLKKYMGYPDYTVHGFRATFRTWVGETTHYGRDLAEYAMAHQVGSDVERSYQRSDLLQKRTKLMEDWANFLIGEK